MYKRLDKFEDRVRHYLSQRPRLYAFIGGVAVVIFWRGVWSFADQFSFMTPLFSIFISTLVMLITGTFVSFFIGARLLISGLREEKRVDEKTSEEINEEEREIEVLRKRINEIRMDVAEIKQILKGK